MSRLRRVLGGMPTAAWGCAAVACLSAISWSFITPPFEAPDEPSHFAYVKQLAETASLPRSHRDDFSREEQFALEALHAPIIRRDPNSKAIFSALEQAVIEERLATFAHSSERGSPGAGVATSQPPLYYALESIPYRLGSGGSLLTRLQLMRLLSALMAGITALFSFLFLREALPAMSWAWTVGGLAIALSPLFGFMSGAVNPDAMLFAVSAAAFYCLARAFHRGLSTRRAAALGAVIAVGLLTKLNFVGLLPGILVGAIVLTLRARRLPGRSAIRMLALTFAIAFSPVLAYALVNILSNHQALGIVSGSIAARHRSPLAELNYIWQLYLPRLPGTVNDFPGIATTRQIWFHDYVGQFGWLDTYFPAWVYELATIVAGVLASLAVCALVRARGALRGRLLELVVYASMAVGLMALVGASSFLNFPAQTAAYGQARYLLPLLPLLGAVFALAARGAGRRWGPVAGTLIVSLALAHDLFSQLQLIARYYG